MISLVSSDDNSLWEIPCAFTCYTNGVPEAVLAQWPQEHPRTPWWHWLGFLLQRWLQACWPCSSLLYKHRPPRRAEETRNLFFILPQVHLYNPQQKAKNERKVVSKCALKQHYTSWVIPTTGNPWAKWVLLKLITKASSWWRRGGRQTLNTCAQGTAVARGCPQDLPHCPPCWGHPVQGLQLASASHHVSPCWGFVQKKLFWTGAISGLFFMVIVSYVNIMIQDEHA